MKIGILGGTFNPPHLGHLRLAEEAAETHGLDRVIFIPCFIPPHKHTDQVAPARDRLEMTERACAGNPLFQVSDVEIAAQGPSYTVNTLETLAGRTDQETYFIIGTDSLRDIHTWKDYERLFQLSHFIVIERPGLTFESAWNEVPDLLKKRFVLQGDHLLHEDSRKIIRSRVLGLDISSTAIRRLLSEGRSIRYLVSEPVLAYITENRLYRN